MRPSSIGSDTVQSCSEESLPWSKIMQVELARA
jgi:hypothetical protein